MEHTLQLTGLLSRRASWSADACSIRRALEIAGTRSAFIILREAFYGTTRFDDFAERAGVSEPVAAARLRELVDDGLLEREPYREAGQRTRMAYRLTDKGADLFPALVALMQWGDRWLAPGGPPVVLRHDGCEEPVRAELRCQAGHQLSVQDIHLTSGRRPGAAGPG
jgi:DNA-binding HxlR family transcriptional regulator